jgi:Concanavalin A-like lectin/glucanases superfamily/Divergent InlB B-repeat domain/Putative Ig domain
MRKYSYDASGNMTNQTLGNVSHPQLGIPSRPHITGQPVSQIVEPGQFVTFSVVVLDSNGVTFQWKFNGTDIAGATGDSLLLSNVSAANVGQYSVLVSDITGSVTSSPAALMLDSDHDGLPDSWEIANFGNTTSQRSEGDPDRDKISNLDEFLDNTNPNSNASLKPQLTVYSDVGGSVTVTPMKLSYDLNETVTLTATPNAPSVFIGWAGDLDTGDLASTTNPATLRITGNKTVRARFSSAVPLPPGLVAFYRGETDASDLIGGHHGTFFSGTGTTAIAPSVTAFGKVGGAFSFDGTVHVRVLDSKALKLAQISVEVWVFPTLLSNAFQTIIAFGSSATENDTWALALSNGIPQFFSHGTDPLPGPSTIPLNQWTHLAISFDGTFKRLYVNGAEVASKGGLGALVYDATPIPVTIGSDWAANKSNSRFNGLIDEVAIYNRALTSNEIADIYNADFVGKNITQPYFTTPSQLPKVALGANFAQQLTTILGTPPISFSLSAGTIPPSMTLSSTGLVSGTASVAGVVDFTVKATDSAGTSNEQLFVLRVVPPIVPPTDLVAWWRGESASGSVVSDIIGAHNGSFFTGKTAAAPSYTTEGEVGGAFVFNGSVYVQVPGAIELRPSEMTVEAWVFPTVQNANNQAVIAHGSSINDDDTWALGLSNGKPRFFSHGSVLLEGSFAIPLNQWTHLAASFDGSTKRLYVNGVEVATQGGLGALVYDSAVPVTIGADWGRNAPTDLFNGRVDEVSLYRRALSAAEVSSIADAGSVGKSTLGPYITSPSRLPFAIVGKTYSQTFTSVLGTLPVGYVLSSSSTLPTGLTLTSTGVLSGVPTNSGTFTFVVRATDAAGRIDEQPCAMQVFDSVKAPAGLVGWWKAEGDALDSVGTNHGTLRNGAVFAAGQVGQAFSLNGTGACIEIPDAPTLRPVSLTLEAWVLFDATSGIRVVFAKPVGTGTSDSYALWLQNGTLTGAVGDATGIGSILSATFPLTTGHWYHVAYTFDDGAKKQALYVNGAQVTIGAAIKSIGYDTQALFLGRDTENGAPNFFLQGRIDEASIYVRSLNPVEIASIYNAGPAGKRLI